MARKQIERVTCDRCGRSWIDGAGESQAGTSMVSVLMSQGRDPTNIVTRHRDLCISCTGTLLENFFDANEVGGVGVVDSEEK